jgi:hypothetical protein
MEHDSAECREYKRTKERKHVNSVKNFFPEEERVYK